MRWLALDIGARRVGAALSDASEKVVTPHGTLAFGSPEALAEQVAGLVARWGVEAVVVGVPLTQGGKSRGEARVLAVVEALRRRLTVPVRTCDERGTTGEALARLSERGFTGKKKKATVDAVAAAVLLETFLALPRERTEEGRVGG